MGDEALMARFQPGNGGRKPGTRNKLQGAFIDALAKHWAENGDAAIDIVFKERPTEYLKIIAGLMPKELTLADDDFDKLTPDEAKEMLGTLRRLRVVGGTDVA